MESRIPLGPGKFHVVVLVIHILNGCEGSAWRASRLGNNMVAGYQHKHLSLTLLQKREFISRGTQKY